MARIKVGGDPENYMDAPQLAVGDDSVGGGGNFIAQLANALGIGQMVGKIGAKVSGKKSQAKAEKASTVEGGPIPPAPTPAGTSVIDSVETALASAPTTKDLMPAPGGMPQSQLTKPGSLKPVDPDVAFKPLFKI